MLTTRYNLAPKNKIMLREAWEAFINDGILSPSISPLIANSWNASKGKNIDPHLPKLAVDYNAFLNFVNKNNLFISAAEETINELKMYFESSSTIIQLFNPEAILLEIYGDQYQIEQMQTINNIPGGRADHNTIGTNAVELAIEHKQPILVTEAEHYCNFFHDITCFAIPIFNKNNKKLLGVLDVTGPEASFTPHTFGLVQAGVSAIEKKLEKHYIMRDSILLDHYFTHLTQGANYILAINTDEEILRYSEKVSLLLGTSSQDWVGHSVSSLVIPNLKRYMMLEEDEIEFYDTLPNDASVRIVLNRIWYKKEFIGWIIKIYSVGVKTEGFKKGEFSSFDELIGSSQAFKKVIVKAKQVASSQVNVLILGESGTGKEMIARAIHQGSNRKSNNFVTVSCGAIPKELIGSELFGFEDGAFSGAKKGGQKGKFEIANEGTIFLDEIGELPMEHQVYLLRVLQEREVYRIGGKKPIPIDVRVIAATNVDLLEAVKNKQFREDLYFRLNVVNLRLPSLRERGSQDIIQLINYFFTFYNRQEGKNVSLTKESLEFLGRYPWRGNVRELENAVYRLVVLSDQAQISLKKIHDLLDDHFVSIVPENKVNFMTIDEVERREILRVLHYFKGNMTKAAKELKISRATLYRKMEKFNIMKDKNIK